MTASEQAARVDLLFAGLLVISPAPSCCWWRAAAGLLRTLPPRLRRIARRPAGIPPPRSRDRLDGGDDSSSHCSCSGGPARRNSRASDPPPGALEVHVVAKQWMWKTRYPNGAREINALHVPRGEAMRLVMTSQDVIHSFFVPAFRLKQDVLPGPLHRDVVPRRPRRASTGCSAPSSAAPTTPAWAAASP